MKHRLPVLALVPVLAALAGLTAPTAPAPAAKPVKRQKAMVFEACRHGCHYRTIQKAVDAAGTYAFKNKQAKVVVAIRPGKYVEGVVVDGTEARRRFDGMTIEGTKKDRERTILEGKNAQGELGAAQNGIEAISVDGLVLKNMWARNYESNGFLIHASGEEGRHCIGYTMNNLLASGNRSYGLSAKNCVGGKMIDSAGYHQGDSAFYVGETPCDSRSGTSTTARPARRSRSGRC